MAVAGGPRILHVLESGDRGGVQRHVGDLARGLPDLTAAVVAGRPGALTAALTEAGVPVAVVPDLVRAIRPDRLRRAGSRVRRLAAERGATVLHAHGVVALAALLASGSALPLLYTPHGMQWRDPARGPAVRAASVAVHRWAAARGAVRALVAVSAQEEADALAMGFPRERVRRLPNGVAVPPPAGAPGAPALGTATRLVAGKDLEALLEALALLPGCRLLLAGDGPLRPALERKAAELGLAGRTAFLGWTEPLDGFYAATWVYVSLSRKEGLPYAVLEAMARGLPVVASDIPGHRDLVRDGETGFLVSTPRDLALRAALLLQDAGRRAAMGARGAAVAAERFSLHAMLAGYRELAAGAVRP